MELFPRVFCGVVMISSSSFIYSANYCLILTDSITRDSSSYSSSSLCWSSLINPKGFFLSNAFSSFIAYSSGISKYLKVVSMLLCITSFDIACTDIPPLWRCVMRVFLKLCVFSTLSFRSRSLMNFLQNLWYSTRTALHSSSAPQMYAPVWLPAN